MSRRALSVILFVCGFLRVSDRGADRGHIAGQDGKKEVRRSPRPPPQKPALLFILKNKKKTPPWMSFFAWCARRDLNCRERILANPAVYLNPFNKRLYGKYGIKKRYVTLTGFMPIRLKIRLNIAAARNVPTPSDKDSIHLTAAISSPHHR